MSPISRREFLLAATGAVGGGLAAAYAPRRPPAPDTTSIVVVGAGMAGLAATRALDDAGWPVRIVEARDRIGGRVRTDRGWGTTLEMGASWIHGTTDNPLMELAGQARAQLRTTDYYGWAKLVVDPALRLQQSVGDRMYLAGEAVGVDNPATVTGPVASGRHAAAPLMWRLGG